jgi:PIN domain nuclease of toxin-antitoxin system
VRALLDTHIAFWFLNDPSKLAGEARATLERSDTRGYVSAASVWETALKEAKGRLSLPEPLNVGAARVGLLELPVTWPHANAAAQLPGIHKDPFDRMLVAQAMLEDLVLLTRDPFVLQYDVATMPA